MITYSKDIKDGAKRAKVKYFTTEAWEDVRHVIECDFIIPMLEKFDNAKRTIKQKVKSAYHDKKISKKDAAIVCASVATPFVIYYTGAFGITKKLLKNTGKKTVEIAQKVIGNKWSKSAFIAGCASACGYKVLKNKSEDNILKIKKELINCLTMESSLDDASFNRIKHAIEIGSVEDLVDLRNDPNIAQYLNAEQQQMIDEYLATLVFARI